MITSRLRTLRDHIRWAVSRFHASELFFGHGTDNAWDEARQLVLGALHLPWEIADSYLDCRLEDDERTYLQGLLKQRIEDRIPTAYLLGEAWFCGMPFVVDERVLIPRSPIAELIGQQFEPWLPHTPARILDLCTGSGCIGIACAALAGQPFTDFRRQSRLRPIDIGRTLALRLGALLTIGEIEHQLPDALRRNRTAAAQHGDEIGQFDIACAAGVAAA